MLRPPKSVRLADQLSSAAVVGFKASAAEQAIASAAPEDQLQAEIKAQRLAEQAVERFSSIGDRLALKRAMKSSATVTREDPVQAAVDRAIARSQRHKPQ